MIVRCLLDDDSEPSSTAFSAAPLPPADILEEVAAVFGAAMTADERLIRRVRALVVEDREHDAVILLETILAHRFDTATAKLLAELHLAHGTASAARKALRVLRGCQMTCPDDIAMLGLVKAAFEVLDHRLAVHALDEEIARVEKARV